jgi:hypothetical protein
MERLINHLIDRIALNLKGLVVFTEAASGPYLWTPLLAACAGAERVYALAADSSMHRAADVEASTAAEADALGVADRVRVVRSKEALGEADVVTNTGPLRPIDAATIDALKPTAVVPLMWESWELMPGMVDLEAARRRGVLVLGTDERSAEIDMRPWSGELALRLLAELGVEPAGASVLVLGRQEILGVPMAQRLAQAGADVVSLEAPYDGLAEHFERRGARYDALVVVEHHDSAPLVAPAGALPPDLVARVNPGLRVGVVAGAVDAEALRLHGISVFPERIAPPGVMSFQAASLGPRPVLELYAAGLKVGAVAARARLEGLDPREAALRALREAPAQDLVGLDAWVSTNRSERR